MANYLDFELGKWGNGTVRLAHWDSIYGEDIVIELLPDGKARLCEWEETVEGSDDPDTLVEVYRDIDLIEYLRGIAQEKKSADED